MPDLLEVKAIDAFYGDFQALFGVSLSVEAGQIIAVIGANGAGKSTLLKTIAGLMRPRQGEILFEGMPVTGTPAFDVVSRGIALVPEGRRLFPSLTVEGESIDRRPIAPARSLDDRAHLRAVPDAGRAASPSGPSPLWRAAADGGNRPSAHGQPATASVR